MRCGHDRERAVGMAWYASDVDGMGGNIREQPADFVVEELDALDLEPLDADAGAYPHLIVRATLTGWDTFDFVSRLARAVDIRRNAIGWAGTKDKRAVTTQLVSISGVTPAEIPDVNHAQIEPVGRFGRSLGFGDLIGNRFDIRIRDATAPDQRNPITDALVVFGDGRIAIPNYFGQQRFGSIRPITHTVGQAIVAGDWERAVRRYLSEWTHDEPDRTKRFRQSIEATTDWTTALESVPGHLQYERTLLQGLAEGADYRSTLDRLPRRLRQLFVHAFQSFLFNRIISERMDRGMSLTEPQVGDVVCFAQDTDALGPTPDPTRTQHVDKRRVRTVKRHVRAGRAFLTAPLIGHDTTLATDDPGNIEQAILADHDVTLGNFDLPEPYDSSGARRAMLVRPTIDWHTDPLRVCFDLPSGSYATVVLREYLKVDPIYMG